MKKRILPVLVALLAVFAMMLMAAPAWAASGGHAGEPGWTEWTNATGLPTDRGNYCLTKDVTINSTWYVPEGETTICLNGKKIQLAEGKTGSVIYIQNGRTLTICDHSSDGSGCITGGNETMDGGGVTVFGTFIMKGGNISGNKTAKYGGGVYTNSGAFTMEGGSISGNEALQGGGVFNGTSGTITMKEGTISGNTANYGGGACNNSTTGPITIEGGSIIGNTATASGGGLYHSSNDCIFKIGSEGAGTGGKDIIISGNKVNGGTENVFLRTASAFKVVGNLSGASKIGITTITAPSDEAPVVFTDGLSGKGSLSNFFSDKGYAVSLTEGDSSEAQLTNHVHKWEFQKKGDEGYAVSCDEANCPYGTHKSYNVKIQAPDRSYIGLPYPGGKVVETPALPSEFSVTPLTYKGFYETVYGPSGDPPTNAGMYTATAELKLEADPNNNKEMSKIFNINKVYARIDAKPLANTLTYNASAQQLVKAGIAYGGTMQYAIGADNQTAPDSGWSDNIPERKNAGPYHVWYKVAGDVNHLDSEPGCVTASIAQKDLTITAIDQIYEYNGRKQGPADKVYADPAEIAGAVSVIGLEGSDKLTNVTVGGQGDKIGTYELVPSNAAIGKDGSLTGNYNINYVNGTLTIALKTLDITVNGSGMERTCNGKQQT